MKGGGDLDWGRAWAPRLRSLLLLLFVAIPPLSLRGLGVGARAGALRFDGPDPRRLPQSLLRLMTLGPSPAPLGDVAEQ